MEIKPLKTLKTVRFSQLVQEFGQPMAVTLWTAPENDRDFTHAIRDRRVLTIVRRNAGTKADYGLVGFFEQPLATYLVFPNALTYPPQTKIVGIKYDQLAEPAPRGPLHRVPRKKPASPTLRQSESLPTGEEQESANSKGAPDETGRKPITKNTTAWEANAPVPARMKPLKRFRAELEVVVREVTSIELEASSLREAKRLAEIRAKDLTPSLERAAILRRVRKLKAIAKDKPRRGLGR